MKIRTWAPSANRALCVPMVFSSSRPFSLSRFTIPPMVSVCTTIARSAPV